MENMKLLSYLLLFLFSFSCINGDKLPTGRASEILPSELYNKIQARYEKIGNYHMGAAIIFKDKYGMIDFKGREILPCLYDSIIKYNETNYLVVLNKKIAIANQKGKILTNFNYDDYKQESCQYIPLKLNNKWGFIDNNGNIKIQHKYDNIKTFNDSLFVASIEGKYGMSKYDETIIIPFEHDDILYRPFFNSSISFYKNNNKTGLINSTNSIITECDYDNWSIPRNGFIVLSKGASNNYETRRFGMIDISTGKIVIPFNYDDLGDYSEGLIMAKKNGKFGYINIKNKIIIPFTYNGAFDFSEGLACVGKHKGYYNSIIGNLPYNTYGFIDKDNNVIIPFKFSDPLFSGNVIFKEGLAGIGISKNNIYATKFGFIDTTGKFIINPIYKEVEPFQNGLAVVYIDNDNEAGVIDKNGNSVIPCKFESCYIRDSIIYAEKDNIKYYFDLNGHKIDAPE